MSANRYKPNEQDISQNPIWKFLQDNCVPWLCSEEKLISESAIIKDEISGDSAVELSNNCELLQGMYKPLRFSVETTSEVKLPPQQLWGIFNKKAADPKTDFDGLKAELSKILGCGIDASVSNTYSVSWSFWPAQFELTVWPQKLQNFNITRAWVDPAREEACHLFIKPGITFIASNTELDEFHRSLPIKLPKVAHISVEGRASLAAENLSVFISPITNYRRCGINTNQTNSSIFQDSNCAFLRISADKKIIFHECMGGIRIFPVEEIKSISVTRMTPARGRGGSWLTLDIASANEGGESIQAKICSASGPDDLNEFAECLANTIGCHLELGPYYPNC